jgi:hypothetical protein
MSAGFKTPDLTDSLIAPYIENPAGPPPDKTIWWIGIYFGGLYHEVFIW